MSDLRAVSLEQVTEGIRSATRPVSILRQTDDTLASWFCANCSRPLYETVKHVTDYNADPVSRAYEEFYSSDQHLKRSHCGHVAPRL